MSGDQVVAAAAPERGEAEQRMRAFESSAQLPRVTSYTLEPRAGRSNGSAHTVDVGPAERDR